VVGATSELEAGFREGLTPAGQRQLQEGIASLLPEAAGWPPMERWWGFRPCTPDEGPLLGASPIPGLWLATGHHRNGVLLAAITAELLAELIAGRLQPEAGPPSESCRRLRAFSWRRFQSGEVGRGEVQSGKAEQQAPPLEDQPSTRQT
jgi:glycine oxidase